MTPQPETQALLPAEEPPEPAPTGDARADPNATVDFVLREVGPTTIVALHPESGAVRGFWLDESTRCDAASWVEARNSTMNLYFCPNRPSEGISGKPKKTDIRFIRALYADIDAKDGRTLVQAYAVAIGGLPIRPTVVVMSGGGYQPLWLLREPLPATPENIARAEAAGAKIAALVGGDAVQNVDRILRLPFTINRPNAKKHATGRVPTPAGIVTTGGERYTLAQIEAALAGAAPVAAAGLVVPFPGSPPAVFAARVPSRLTAAAQANLSDRNWFDELPSEKKNALLRAIATSPAGQSLADTPRSEWLRFLFAFADAAERGADEARAIALDWCETSARFTNEDEFDRDWMSFSASKPGGVTVATLISAAVGAGFDLRPWRPAHPVAPSIITVVEHPATKPVSLTAIPPTMDTDQALELMNSAFVFVHSWGSEALIAHRQPDGSYRALDEKQFLRSLANRRVVAPGGTEKPQPLGRWWLSHPDRHEVDRTVFDPEQTQGAPATQSGETTLNLWTGFARQPLKGSYRRINAHLFNVVCNRDRACWRYLIKWLAHAVQHPGEAPGTVIVLRSDSEGTGKSVVLEIMSRIFGKHALLLNSPEDLIGSFNDHLENCCFIGLNEPSFPGDHHAAAKLKSMITESTWLINGKYRAARRVPNIAHIMLTTNQEWAIPAGNKARRFLMLDVNESRARDRKYFGELWDEINDGGVEGLLYALMRVRVGRDALRDVPRTSALRRQQLQSASSMTQWAGDAVSTGELVPAGAVQAGALVYSAGGGGGFGARLPASALYRSYCAWAMGMKMRSVSVVEFGRWLSRCGIPAVRSKTERAYNIPDARSFAAAVLQAAGIVGDG